MAVRLHHYTAAEQEQLLSKREGELRLGQQVTWLNSIDALAHFSGKYVLLGIPESVGVVANGGLAGTESLWKPALKALLAIQSNAFLSGSELGILGVLLSEDSTVFDIDIAVSQTISQIISSKKIPIVIGGGHNNAYGNLKGASQALGKPIHCINMDAHADLRKLEGRHSGNGFSYALQEGYLRKYAAFGLHESYNNQHILDQFNQNPDLKAVFFEDLFIRNTLSFEQGLQVCIDHVKGQTCGIELDLDAIQGVLSSAISPCGFSSIQARQYLHRCASELDIAYLHLCEGAVELKDGRKDSSTAKLVAYLVADFLKAC